MVLYGDFVLITLSVSALSGIATILLLLALPPRRSFKITGIILSVICIFSFFAATTAGAIFSEHSVLYIQTEKNYSEPIISSVNFQLNPLENTQYYLLKDGTEYRYFCTDSTEYESRTPTANVSYSEIIYGTEKPNLVVEKTTRKYYAEWLFLYSYGSETETKYIFTIPSKDSILDLNNS